MQKALVSYVSRCHFSYFTFRPGTLCVPGTLLYVRFLVPMMPEWGGREWTGEGGETWAGPRSPFHRDTDTKERNAILGGARSS